MSYTAVLFPILSVLSVAENTFLGTGKEWITKNDQQSILMNDYYYPKRNELTFFAPDEMKSIASRKIAEVNRFLKDNGFEIQLEENTDDDFAVASILKIALKWKKEGTKCEITHEGNEYPAVRMERQFRIYHVRTAHPVVSIYTENGDILNMTIAKGKPREGFELVSYIRSLSRRIQSELCPLVLHKTLDGLMYSDHYFTEFKDVTFDYAGVVFPMVDLKQQVDLSWLIGMGYPPDARISQALQETHFKMNEKGAIAKSAVAIAVKTECAAPTFKQPYIIDKPFYLWIERPGMSMPLFTAYITPADWKAPQNLD